MSHIFCIANPNSGKNTKHPHILARIQGQLQNSVHTSTFCSPHNLHELDKAMEQCIQEKTDILCINGGDGTIHKTLTALYKIYGEHTPYPKIAILKGGTMNNIARNMGISLWTSAYDMLDIVTKQQTYRCTTKHPLIIDNTHMGFIFGNAGLSAFLEEYYKDNKASAYRAGYLLCKAVLSAIFHTAYAHNIFQPVDMDITLKTKQGDAKQIKEAITLLGVSSIADLGLYFRPFYATLSDSRCAHLIAMTCSPLYIALSLPHILLAKPTNKTYILDQPSTEIQFSYTHPQSYTIDGDMYISTCTQNIRVGPALEFVIG